ncbi:DHA2 family efflux MFS transporter permease subunit [Deinococcus metallilatus]|uniref:EmrB/QacA subfamily drug resistance transporter n=1 Tax=Deinococcus metallilatus TaxID=1211322 RepID=A0AAJ5F735_9DEIO|nr:MDR family MFS transporter [Deinococcus metallilatus]MBB5294146.1 EmrB/QacA subfamily drug resistance transporter [Deinococcus metallilatus]QBY08928.1 DHA2 family efflux MFS transporter permease subunit [Deinococcus metallilatus]RXJ10072.1 DHA2 family efflux MFS transporter permease subunit [Deinococcus metallilatus]TLK27991.1 MFS transporter [Deinococcus metallilatus]GMA16517.1 MFS transporter [Deinococcus metallilatus]
MTAPTPPQRINYAQTLDMGTKRVILFGVLLGLFLSALDQTIVATAMPRIAADLSGLNLYAWVTTAYLLTNTALVPIYGKLSDLYGRKPVLMIGIAIFLLGSALCGLSGEAFLGNLFGGGMMQLVVFRGLQGIGAAALGSVAFAIVADLFEPVDRPRYQGLFGAVFGLSSVIGPLLGGFLTDHLSWRWVFYVNLPLGLIALAFIASKMPRLASGLQAKVDWLGAFLIIVFAVPLLLALTWGADNTYAWTSPTLLGLFGLSAAALIAFLFVEARNESPILPLTLFRNPTFAWGAVARFLIGAGFLGAILFLSLYLVQVQGVSATKAGTATIPLTAGLIVGAIGSGQIASRIGRYKVLMLGGLIIAALGFYSLSTLTADSPYSGVILRMVLLGLGLGPTLPLYTTALQLAVKPWEIGVATSAGQFFQQMGSTIGTAIFGAVLTAGLTTNLATQFAAQAAAQQGTVATTLKTIGERIRSGEGSGGQNRNATPPTPAQIRSDFAALRRNVTRAIETGDPAAIAAIQKDPNLPAEAKSRLTALPAGGVAAGVRAGFDQAYGSVAQAVNSGHPAQVAAVAANPQLPAPLRQRLAQIPPQALASAPARQQILAGIKQGLDAAAPAAAQQAQQQALDAALTGVNDGERIALASARAQKVAFADTIASIYRYSILVALLAFLATLMMPDLTMPTRQQGQRMAPAHVEM